MNYFFTIFMGADEAGISNVFVMPRGGSASEKVQLTFFKTPEIIQFFWSGDSNKVLLLKEEGILGSCRVTINRLKRRRHATEC